MGKKKKKNRTKAQEIRLKHEPLSNLFLDPQTYTYSNIYLYSAIYTER